MGLYSIRDDIIGYYLHDVSILYSISDGIAVKYVYAVGTVQY